MWFVGLDVHKKVTTMCILNQRGVVVKEERLVGPACMIADRLAAVRATRLRLPQLAVCYEASCGYGPLHDQLKSVASRVVVAHPSRLRLIFNSKRKNDRVDAKKLAMLLLLGHVPAIHVPSIQVRAWRQLIEHRHRTVAKRTATKNALRSLLRNHAIPAPHRKGLWTRAGRAWLAALTLPDEAAALQRDLLLAELAQFDQQIKRMDRELNRLARSHPGVGLLKTIPGVGPRTAEAIVAYIDRPTRFSRTKCVGSYFGLVPCQDQSADRNHLGHITREGPSRARHLLTEAAWRGIRCSDHVRSYFERIQHGDPERKKIALVATAHYLVRVMLAMLRTGEVWRYDTKKKDKAA